MFLERSSRDLFSFLSDGGAWEHCPRMFRQEALIACSVGGGGGSQDMVTYTNLLPTYIPNVTSWAQAYLLEAMSMSESNFTQYPGDTYAPQDANEIAGIDALADRGTSGAPVEIDGKELLEKLYGGEMLNANPKITAHYAKKIEALLEEFDDYVLPEITNAHAFAFGGSDHNVAEAKAAKRLMAEINKIAAMFYEDYVTERAAMNRALIYATPYGLQCYRDAEILRQAGAFEREYEQGRYQDAWDSWNEANIIPVRNLDIAGNAVRTVLGTMRMEITQSKRPSTLQQVAGLALAGIAIGSMFAGTTLNPHSNPAAKVGTTDLSRSSAALEMSRREDGTFFNPYSLGA